MDSPVKPGHDVFWFLGIWLSAMAFVGYSTHVAELKIFADARAASLF